MIEDPTPTDNNDLIVEPTSTNKSHHYQPQVATTKRKSKWLWVLPLLIVTLIVGLITGRMLGQKQVQQQGDSLTTTEAGKNESLLHRLGVSMGLVEEKKVDVVPSKPVLTVEVITPQQSVVPETITADGTIAPKSVATVNSKVNGVTIEQVLVDEGDRVNQGDVLAIFDTQAMEQQAYQAQADLMEAQTRLGLATSDVNRITPLVAMQAISEQERDRYMATANQAAAAVEAAKARLSNQNLMINNARVVAPVSGIISEKNANVGSVAGSGTLFTIIKDGELEWQANIDPSQLKAVTVGTPVQVSLPQDDYVTGQVTRIAPTADTGSRQVGIYATLNKNPMVRAGMYQRGTLLIGKQNKQILPTSAITSQDGYDYIMLVQPDTDVNGDKIYRVKRRKINLGERQNNAVILEETLPDNTAIVRQGASFLNDGDVVSVVNDNQTRIQTPQVNTTDINAPNADLPYIDSPNVNSPNISSPDGSQSQIMIPVSPAEAG